MDAFKKVDFCVKTWKRHAQYRSVYQSTHEDSSMALMQHSHKRTFFNGVQH